MIGKWESRRSDIVRAPLEIVCAEVKTDTAQLITAFGQACAYKLFSHKVYLVVPRQSSKDEIDRIDSLCAMFGIGLVLFDCTNPEEPRFERRVRAEKHEPDTFYLNRSLAKVEKDLFS